MTVAYSPDGMILVSGSQDCLVKLWNLETFQEIKTLQGHMHLVCSAVFSPDGATLASASSDSTIKLWSMDNFSEIITLEDH